MSEIDRKARQRKEIAAASRVAMRALVQLNAPLESRGRVVGLFNMASLGMRAFSGLTVGLLGEFIGIHWSLGLSAALLAGLLPFLYRMVPARPKIDGGNT